MRRTFLSQHVCYCWLNITMKKVKSDMSYYEMQWIQYGSGDQGHLSFKSWVLVWLFSDKKERISKIAFQRREVRALTIFLTDLPPRSLFASFYLKNVSDELGLRVKAISPWHE